MSAEKTYFGESIVYLRFVEPEEIKNNKNIVCTSVHCFPVEDDKILFTVNPRGIDIIGGHVENGETVEEALVRESIEEGCIIPEEYEIIGAIEVDNRDNPKAIEKGYPLKGYQIFYKVTKFKLLPFEQKFECVDRVLVPFEEISSKHHKWLGVHNQILEKISEIKKLKM